MIDHFKSTTIVLASLITIGLYAQSEYTFVFLNKKTDSEKLPQEQIDKLMEGHMANITRLAEEGKLHAAGPFDAGGGLFVFKSNSVEEVRDWISTDPAVKANRWDVEIFDYQPQIGSICRVNAPYEMVSYYFIRFLPIPKPTVGEIGNKADEQHRQYWKSIADDNVVTFASLGKEGGDILVTVKPVDESALSNDPAVNKGLIKFDRKGLWIAKGSFCE